MSISLLPGTKLRVTQMQKREQRNALQTITKTLGTKITQNLNSVHEIFNINNGAVN
jgi:hypothetical protein